MMNIYELTEKIAELISLHQEGEYWDFKREWYKNKTDMLHDIICMANNLTTNDGYIIIGVDEECDFSIHDIGEDSNRRNTENLVSFLREKKFAGGIRPTIMVKSIILDARAIDIIIVRNDRNTPYYLTEAYKGVYANNIYTRIMDTNTPKNLSADINMIEKLWKKRFGIDASAIERVKLFLKKPKEWIESEERTFYKYAPEFTIERISAEEDRDAYEFYLFAQNDSNPHWYDINIFYHQTLLDSIDGTYLDGGRCFTSSPSTAGVNLSDDVSGWDVSYKYFIKDSIEYIVHNFYITDDTGEELTARNKFMACILVFDSEMEKNMFNQYIRKEYLNHDIHVFDDNLPYFPKLEGYNMEVFKKRYLNALLLKQLLNNFRITL